MSEPERCHNDSMPSGRCTLPRGHEGNCVSPAQSECVRLRAVIREALGKLTKASAAHKVLYFALDEQSAEMFYADPVEDIALALATELEDAELSRNDFVTVNREKLRAIARRVLAKAGSR